MSRSYLRESLIVMTSIPLALLPASSCRAGEKPEVGTAELQNKAISVLQAAMKEGDGFEKVHAAEALIWTGHPEGVREYFLEQDRTADTEPWAPYRIGIWRVLYRMNAGNPAGQRAYLSKILAAFSDPMAKDQGISAETLGKLKYTGSGNTALVAELAERGKADVRVCAQWIRANSGKAEDEARLVEFLGSKKMDDRQNAAYALRHFNTIRPATLNALQCMAPKEPPDGEVRCYVLGALYTHLPADQRDASKRELLNYVASGNTDQRYQSCMALANWPTGDMVTVVENLLDNKPSDERVGAAYVLLRMGRPRDRTDPNH
jgi:hypothetical protein